MNSPLKKWYSAHRGHPRFNEKLQILLGYALVDVFRRSSLENTFFSPEKALSQALLLSPSLFPKGFFDWIASPEHFSEEIVEFCEKSKNFNLKNLSNTVSVLDLRGVPCPKNAVRCRLVLEGISEGTELDLYLDEGPPIENVPQSLAGLGHKVLFREKNGNYWHLRVRKKENA